MRKMKGTFSVWGKYIAAGTGVMDAAAFILLLSCAAGKYNAGIAVYAAAQALFCTGLLIWGHFFLKPYIARIRQSCEDFENGKTLKLELSPDDLKRLGELKRLAEKVNEVVSRNDRLLLSHKEAEYMALQNQMNPHFLYNTLEAIRGDALRAGISSIAGTAEALASFFRYTVSGGNLLSTVEEELMNIRNYFLIQRYRFGEDLRLEVIFIDEEAEIRKMQIPKLTLQPIVENCVFHGLETKRNKGTIRISFDQTQKFLFISVKDNGIGMSEEELKRLNASIIESPFQAERETMDAKPFEKSHTGIALKNVSQRIKLLYGNEYGITVYSTLDIGTNVKIILPRKISLTQPENDGEE